MTFFRTNNEHFTNDQNIRGGDRDDDNDDNDDDGDDDCCARIVDQNAKDVALLLEECSLMEDRKFRALRTVQGGRLFCNPVQAGQQYLYCTGDFSNRIRDFYIDVPV